MSIVELRPGEQTRGKLSSAASQQYFFVNVSSAMGRDLSTKGSIAENSLSVQLRRPPGEAGADLPMVLSACLDALPCGTSGCSCPSQFVDDGSSGGRGDSTRSVQVSPCDLASGIWYLSVEAKPGSKLSGAQAIPFEVTATFGEAQVFVGQEVAGSVCCMQPRYYALDVNRIVRGHEIVIRVASANPLQEQRPVRISSSFEGCVDAMPSEEAPPAMGMLVIPPEMVQRGRLLIGLHSVDRGSASYFLRVSYRAELKPVVVAFLVSMLLLVLGTFAVVCAVRVRRRMWKGRDFHEQLKARRKALKMSVRGVGGVDGGGELELSDSDGSDEEVSDLLGGGLLSRRVLPL